MSGIIGQPVSKPNAVVIGSQFVLAGAGQSIDGKADNFFFLRQPVSKSVQFSAHLIRVDKRSLQSLCGIMIRESDDPDAPFAFIGVSSVTLFSIHRGAKGETCRRVHQELRNKAQAISFRISPGTNSFATEYSVDATNWTMLSPFSPSLPSMWKENCLVGLAVCSGNTNITVTAYFDNVQTNSLARIGP